VSAGHGVALAPIGARRGAAPGAARGAARGPQWVTRRGAPTTPDN